MVAQVKAYKAGISYSSKLKLSWEQKLQVLARMINNG